MTAPHSHTTYDYVFAGAGGSSILLLLAMEQKGLLAEKQVVIFEPDTSKQNDRTWCFWSDRSDAAYQLCKNIISREYHEIVVGSKVYAIKPFRYYQLRSADLYQQLTRLLGSYPNIQIENDLVKKVEQQEGLVTIHTGSGQTHCKLFFDSRPPTLEGSGLLLWQSFVGWRIKTANENFEPGRATFMDFSIPQSLNTEFMYVLPDSPTEALVEHTRFAKPILEEQQSELVLRSYLAQLGVGDFEIRDREIAKIPMTNRLSSNQDKYPDNTLRIDIGVRAGAAKASTGFAFKTMAQHADEVAMAIAEKRTIPRLNHPSRFQMYDEMLLELLDQSPEKGHLVFQKMFETMGPKAVFKFLDEKTTFAEDLEIMWNSPRGHFIKAGSRLLHRTLFRRLPF